MPEALLNSEHQLFPETRWTLIQRLQDSDEPGAALALSELCEIYNHPLYAYARKVYGQEGEDLVQGFLAAMLRKKGKKGIFRKVERVEDKKLRSFVLVCFKRYASRVLMRDEQGKQLQEEAGQLQVLSTPEASAADQLYHRKWAIMLMNKVLARMRAEWEFERRGTFFDDLIRCMRDGRGEITFAAIAAKEGLTSANVRQIARRLRKQFKEYFFEEVRPTVTTEAELEEEIAFLMSLLS